jgi:hypothetical protein
VQLIAGIKAASSRDKAGSIRQLDKAFDKKLECHKHSFIRILHAHKQE